ncbi:LysR family transcriptional regulator [Paraburkholderia edwinii]|uniref:LysR family transcriptional regulator n=1 Tax=Paraburkholderia edwinii TaxID=2861782 RepID=A0ABX8UXK1_9BURK|nr:LysR family transcriptional regulator [Paraburkholderia edwinii]QYD71960.1 LysR family transcriptional regulator [Paraburkholderia edwinii]
MNMNRLSWDDLRVFLAVSRAGNLSKAGRLLGMDHATVGRRISALEFALETPVFERDRQGYRLNAQGREMLAHVEAVEANVLTLGDLMNGALPGHAGHVRIATMEGIASLYLSEQFVKLKQRHPGLTVELVTSATDVRISHREADLFLGFFEPRGVNLDIEHIGRFALHLYAHPDYLAAFGTPRTIDELRAHRFVGYVDDLIQLDAVRWLDDAIAEPPIAFHSTSMIAQMFAAAAGAGIVMLPEFARAERFGLALIPLKRLEVTRDVWMSSHQYLRRVPRIAAVASFLTEIMARDYPLE